MNERREWRKSEKEAFILRNLKNYVLNADKHWDKSVKLRWWETAKEEREIAFIWISGGYDKSGYRAGSLLPSENGIESSELIHLSYIRKEELTKEGFEKIREKMIEKVLDEKSNFEIGYVYYWDWEKRKHSPFAQYQDGKTKQFIDGLCLTPEQNERLEKEFKARNYQQILANLDNYEICENGYFFWFARDIKGYKDLGDKYQLIGYKSLTKVGWDKLRERIVNKIIAEKANWEIKYSPVFPGSIEYYAKKDDYDFNGLQYRHSVLAFTKEQTARLRKALNINPEIPFIKPTPLTKIDEETDIPNSQHIPTDNQEKESDTKLTNLLEKIQNPNENNVQTLSDNLKEIERMNEKELYHQQISKVNSLKEKLFSLVSIADYSKLIVETINNKLVKFGVMVSELSETEMIDLAKLNNNEITEKQTIDNIDKQVSQSIGEISAKKFLDQLLSKVKSVLDKNKEEKEKVKDELIQFSKSDNIFWKTTHQTRQAEVQQALSSLETSSFSAEPTNYWPWILGGLGITAVLGIIYLLLVKNKKKDKNFY